MSIIKTQDKTEQLLTLYLWLRRLLKAEHTTCQFMSSRSIVFFFPLCTIIQSKTIESQRRPLHRNLRLTWLKNDLVPYIHAGPL